MDWICVGQAFLLGLWNGVKVLGILAAATTLLVLTCGGLEYIETEVKQRSPRVHKILSRVLTGFLIVLFGTFFTLLAIASGLEAMNCKVG